MTLNLPFAADRFCWRSNRGMIARRMPGNAILTEFRPTYEPYWKMGAKRMNPLFTPLQVGDLNLPNRVIMAPLTRCRAAAGRVPSALMAEYYAQRASAGLILSEAVSVMPMGNGYPDTPGIWTDEQVKGWRRVTEAVHAAGGRIFAQFWHVGRISDPEILGGERPVAPSAIAAAGQVSLLRPKRAYPVPRALETGEIAGIVEAFRQAAVNAKAAGFDGVELHGANGYLLDQFLQDRSNRRTDAYGGSIEKRARLLLEVTDAAIAVWGAGRVGVHLSPRGDSHDMGDSAPGETFGYVARELGKRRIAFLFVRESRAAPRLGPRLKADFGGVFIANEGLGKADAEKLIESGEADAAAFGVNFIANPDLPWRFLLNAPLNAPRPESFYGCGLADFTVGYTDYPRLHDGYPLQTVPTDAAKT
jgi:2,4-dienoyl-CoA reductase-like NADH-dependent reductase (Old Yellow Enzyme family)